jgi:PelA/Pel-15E family pectate lyase
MRPNALAPLRCVGLCVLGLLGSARLAPADTELATRAEAGLRKVTEYLTTQVAVGGGYLGTYTADLSDQWGETHATRSQNWIQPPGSPSVGQAFLRAWQATGEPCYLDAATQVAKALAYGQLECGGWDYIVDHSPAGATKWYYRHNRDSDDPALKEGRNQATFDDNVSQAATCLLIAVDTALQRQDAAIHDATMAALEFILAAQHECGGWPQRFPPTGRGYGDFLTFNDNTMADLVETMMLAYRTYGDARYAAAVRRCADFIVKAQLPAPQATWAQQYDFDLQPAWARRFEPPCACAGESLGVMRLLIKLATFTGDAAYLEPLPAALDWYERSKLPDGRWARFYELKTNRPLYFTKDTYWLTYSDADLPTHYGFKGKWDPASVAQALAEIRQKGLTQYQQDREPRTLTEAERHSAAAALEPKVRAVLDAQDAEGRWVTSAGGYMPAGAPRLDMATFQRNMRVLSDYLTAVKGQ